MQAGSYSIGEIGAIPNQADSVEMPPAFSDN